MKAQFISSLLVDDFDGDSLDGVVEAEDTCDSVRLDGSVLLLVSLLVAEFWIVSLALAEGAGGFAQAKRFQMSCLLASLASVILGTAVFWLVRAFSTLVAGSSVSAWLSLSMVVRRLVDGSLLALQSGIVILGSFFSNAGVNDLLGSRHGVHGK